MPDITEERKQDLQDRMFSYLNVAETTSVREAAALSRDCVELWAVPNQGADDYLARFITTDALFFLFAAMRHRDVPRYYIMEKDMRLFVINFCLALYVKPEAFTTARGLHIELGRAYPAPPPSPEAIEEHERLTHEYGVYPIRDTEHLLRLEAELGVEVPDEFREIIRIHSQRPRELAMLPYLASQMENSAYCG